jgi:glycosyltransferase involved in cell wall biosynthesis
MILRDNGFSVRIVGAHGLGTDAFDAHRLPGIDVRLVSRAGTGIVQKVRYLWFLFRATGHVIVTRARWVYASDPFSTPVALVAAWMGRDVVYHEHDTPSSAPASRFLRALLVIRRMALRRAAVLVTPNVERSAALSRDAGGRNALTVWNCPSRLEARSRTDEPDPGDLRLIYHGSVVPSRLPLAVVDAMARTHGRVTLRLTGYETIGSRGYLAQLRRRADELRIGDRLQITPPLPRELMLDGTANGDLGLALMPTRGADENERAMAGASNKAFEYLACGLPILVTDLPDWREMFVQSGVAFACDPTSVSSLATAFDRAFDNRSELAAMGRRGRAIVEREWNYETCFEPVLRRMLGERPAAAAAATTHTREEVA